MRTCITVLVGLLLVGSTVAVAGGDGPLEEPLVKPGEVRQQPTELEKPTELALDRESYPDTDGSTSAEPLGVWIVCRLLNRPCGWRQLISAGERRLYLGKADAGDEEPVDGKLRGQTQHHGTHTAYTRLIKGKEELIYECRLPSADERELMEKKGVELEFIPVALDAFVFLRHKKNPVEGLTREQVRDIYTPADDDETEGRISNWKEVGGSDRAIQPYVRNRNSGSQVTMERVVMQDREMVGGRSMIGHSMTGPYNLMNRDETGIGFTFYYYQRYMSPLKRNGGGDEGQEEEAKPTVRMLVIDGVRPTRENIARRKYPWVTEVYVVTRKDLQEDHPAAKLRDWLLTEEGQAVIGETGYVPITRAAEAAR